jgi:hypothetical protein
MARRAKKKKKQKKQKTRKAKKSGATENHIDGCLCDIDIDELDAVDDKDLPAASGGVVINVRASGGDEAESDGPEFVLSEADATPDEELPAATGGVAVAPR